MTTPPIIELDSVSKSYGSRKAVDRVSFSIAPGSVFGLLGPNGAGKTSILEMIEGLRTPDSGSIRVQGVNVREHPAVIKQWIGAQLQHTALQDELKVGEAFRLFRSFYSRPRDSGELLALIGLGGKDNLYFRALSGGDRQRLALGLALIGNPAVILLDEPTVGLDADVRRSLHELIFKCRAEGKAILLTTHYLEEASKLCDQVGILQQGVLRRIAAPAQIIRENTKGDVVRVVFEQPAPLPALAALEGVDSAANSERWHVLYGGNIGRILSSVAQYASATRNGIVTIQTEEASLEDAYLSMTRTEEVT